MSDSATLAERYIAAWNETDARRPPARGRAALDRRRAATSTRWSRPRATTQIAATIGAVQEQFPGFVFRLAGPVDGHHDQARFSWELGRRGSGAAPIAGSDVAVTDGNGPAAHGARLPRPRARPDRYPQQCR